ncbi:hypothetical protein CDFC105_43983 [Clostridioides difficile]|nr:hypothetical protein CDFC105_43983 [Clostridioides difficile]
MPSLVGSEMCIRDRSKTAHRFKDKLMYSFSPQDCSFFDSLGIRYYGPIDCLLYTSDAADDSLRVDLGRRRAI